MEQTFYVNVLFGKNKARIFDELSKVLATTRSDYHFQIHPFRISPVAELSDGGQSMQRLRSDIKQHLSVLQDIRASDLKSVERPFANTIFVNYTTRELEPAIKFDRVRFYLCDYVDEHNIEILTLVNPIFVNFLKKAQARQQMPPLNSIFLNYSVLTFYDTRADSRVADATNLDIGEETADDVAHLLQTRLQMSGSDVDNDRDEQAACATNGIILPYHPFRHSLFIATQNIKDNINAVLLSRNRHMIYYPFGQEDWLLILRNIMYERVFLNFLITDSLYSLYVDIPKSLFRNSASYTYRHFRRLQRKHKTHVLNELTFNYKTAFRNNSNVYAGWYNRETKVDTAALLMTPFAMDVLCARTSNGILI